MPLSHDQPLNAARVRDLGVAKVLPPAKFTSVNVIDSLRQMIEVPEVWTRCKALAMKCAQRDGRIEACDAIEAFARTVRAR